MNSPESDAFFTAYNLKGIGDIADFTRKLERERDEARNAHKIQQANYIELYEAVMGEGCHTSEVHDIIEIARRHREESEIVRRVLGLPFNIAMEASLTAYRDDYAALKQLHAARAAEIP